MAIGLKHGDNLPLHFQEWPDQEPWPKSKFNKISLFHFVK